MLISLLMGLSLSLLTGCWHGNRNDKTVASGPATTAAEPTLRVVNVLSKELYDDAHIAGSIQVPFEDVEHVALTWDKKTPVVFYCSNYQCTASGEAARMLQEMGFEQVYAYEGGTAQWYALAQHDSAYKLVGPTQQAYLKLPLVEHSTAHEGNINVVTAEQLRDMMVKSNIL